MKNLNIKYGLLAIVPLLSATLYAQNMYNVFDDKIYKGDFLIPMYLGNESTTKINMPDVEYIGYNVLLTTPNVEYIEIGRESRDANIYIYNYGCDFFNTKFHNSEPAAGMMSLSKLSTFAMHQPGYCEFPINSHWRYPYQLTFVPHGIGVECEYLSHVVLPTKAQCIFASFTNCPSLPTITLPACIGYIGGSFNDCASLRDIRVRSGYVTEIDGSFDNLPEDAVIYVPKGFKNVYENSAWGEIGRTIAEDPDYDCGYTPEQLPQRGVTVISDEDGTIDVALGMNHYHFEGFDEDGEPLFYSDAELEISRERLPEVDEAFNVVAIGDYAMCGAEYCRFSGTDYYGEPFNYIPETVERIGAFVASYVSKNLIVETLHEGITSIGRKAFSNSRFGNETISLPSTLETLGEGAFDRHSGSLNTVRCAAAVPPVCGDARVFGDKSRLELVVPEGSREQYENAPVWQAFSLITEDAALGAVGSIMADINGAAEAEYYTLDGRRVAADALTPGIYVVCCGTSATKKIIRP